MHIEGVYDEQNWYGAVAVDGKPLTPGPSQKLRNHSPDGFSWGYAGSGPAQLALAILLAAGVPERKALGLYQRFKAKFIAPLDSRASFSLDIDILQWVAEHEALAAIGSEDYIDGQSER